MGADHSPLGALSLTVERAGVPYGYTLTIWSAGALCIRRFGLPDLAEVFLFVIGGTLGYVTLALWAKRQRGDSAPQTTAQRKTTGPLWENAVVLPALALTAGVGQLLPGAGASFLVVPFVATVAYLVGLAQLVSMRPVTRISAGS